MKSFGQRARGARLERMRASPMWAGDGFRNIHPAIPGLRDLTAPTPSMKDFLYGGERRTPSGALPLVDPREVWRARPASGLRVTWLGHSTLLLEIDGYRVLTDPVWGPRASPFTLLGPKRFHRAPVALHSMPPVDAVVLSHDHYDHLDYPTIKVLAKSGVPFVTSLGVGAHLEAWGVPAQLVCELDWWEAHTVAGTGLTITAAPSQHFSGRGLRDRNATLWSSMVIRGERHAAFFSGDTGLTTQYAEVGRRLGPFDLVMLEIGAFHPAWGDIHLGPENALQALQLLGGGNFLPIHWGTFALAMHAWDQPAEAIYELAPGTGARLLMPRLGEAIEPVQVDRVEPWWRAVDAARREFPAELVDEATPPRHWARPVD
jgi:L-ascorbate metabolism protein UlaG (beta-lactamase superfamily)